MYDGYSMFGIKVSINADNFLALTRTDYSGRAPGAENAGVENAGADRRG